MKKLLINIPLNLINSKVVNHDDGSRNENQPMHLIFDFDGTIVDSFDRAVEKFNILAEEFCFRKVYPTELEMLKNLSSRELVKYLKIPVYKIPRVIYKARKYMNSDIPKLASFLNLPQILQRLYNENFSLGILTSNSEKNVMTWLDIHQMKYLFNFIHVESNFFGKARVIKKILKKYNINKKQAFYIGDETRDIEAAKQNGIFSVAVTWGFNSEKILLRHQPHFIVRKPEDLLSIWGL